MQQQPKSKRMVFRFLKRLFRIILPIWSPPFPNYAQSQEKKNYGGAKWDTNYESHSQSSLGFSSCFYLVRGELNCEENFGIRWWVVRSIAQVTLAKDTRGDYQAISWVCHILPVFCWNYWFCDSGYLSSKTKVRDWSCTDHSHVTGLGYWCHARGVCLGCIRRAPQPRYHVRKLVR